MKVKKTPKNRISGRSCLNRLKSIAQGLVITVMNVNKDRVLL